MNELLENQSMFEETTAGALKDGDIFLLGGEKYRVVTTSEDTITFAPYDFSKKLAPTLVVHHIQSDKDIPVAQIYDNSPFLLGGITYKRIEGDGDGTVSCEQVEKHREIAKSVLVTKIKKT